MWVLPTHWIQYSYQLYNILYKLSLCEWHLRNVIWRLKRYTLNLRRLYILLIGGVKHFPFESPHPSPIISGWEIYDSRLTDFSEETNQYRKKLILSTNRTCYMVGSITSLPNIYVYVFIFLYFFEKNMCHHIMCEHI